VDGLPSLDRTALLVKRLPRPSLFQTLVDCCHVFT
jgi:hypothetical protein